MAEIIITYEEMRRIVNSQEDPFWNDETAQRYHDEFIRHQETENRLIVLATALAFSVAGLFVSCVAMMGH